MAMTDEQRRWLYVLVAAIVGGLVRSSCYDGSNDETCETPKAAAPKAALAAAETTVAEMSPLILKRGSASRPSGE
jgi:hypothetical protein